MRSYIIKVDNEAQLMKIRKYFKECKVTQDLEVATYLLRDRKCCIQILNGKIKYIDKYTLNPNTPIIQYASWLRRRNYDKANKTTGKERVVKELKQKEELLHETFSLFTKNARFECIFIKTVWKVNVVNKTNNATITTLHLSKKYNKPEVLKIIKKFNLNKQ
jgi:hypothetical protein